ncbi:MAG: hypothetical protein JWQ41_2267, partial [Variovorax sp.]|nr:hypothetical protein [Variovorax sp.]
MIRFTASAPIGPIAAAAALLLALSGCADMAGIDSHATMRDAKSLGFDVAAP